MDVGMPPRFSSRSLFFSSALSSFNSTSLGRVFGVSLEEGIVSWVKSVRLEMK
jgi:hypothetical protein